MPNPVYLVTAYAVFWALTFVLVGTMWLRMRQLESQLAVLESQLDERAEGNPAP
jgi:hypothetical protein